jgi:AraC-like DNA-binding protein
MLLSVSFFGFFLAGIILIFSSFRKSKNTYLAAYLLFSNLFSLIYYLIFQSESVDYAAFFALNFTPFYFLSQPFLHLYISSQRKDFKLKPIYFVLFVPFLIILINISPYIWLPFSEKRVFATAFLQNAEVLYQAKLLFLPYYYQSLIRPIFNLLLLLFTYFTYYKNRHAFEFQNAKFNERNFVFAILLISGLLNSMSFIFIVNKLLISTFEFGILTDVSFVTINSFVSYLYVGQNLLLLFFPQILFKELFNAKPREKSKKDPSIKSESTLSVDRLNEIEVQIQEYVSEEKPYLVQGFSLTSISQNTGIPSHQLSYYFNDHLKTNFNDWKNHLRIEYVVSEINQGKHKNFTLESLASSSGFASRANFNKAFLVEMNQTPTEYIKNKTPQKK